MTLAALALGVGVLTVRADERAPADPRAAAVLQALALIGTPYRYGGDSPVTGFDCSGLIRHVFAPVLGRPLPRRSEDMVAAGEPVSLAAVEPGDLLFFNTLRRANSHVALYVGQGRFVHAPAGRGQVRVERLDDGYWSARFDGAVRLLAP